MKNISIIIITLLLIGCATNKKIQSSTNQSDTTTINVISSDSSSIKYISNENHISNTSIDENVEIIKIDSINKITTITKINRIIKKDDSTNKIDTIYTNQIKRDSIQFSSINALNNTTNESIEESHQLKYISIITICITICIALFALKKVLKIFA